MKSTWVLLLLTLALAEAFSSQRGLIMNLHLTGIYYRCPCENGLSCEVDRTIIGTITNTDYGICEDPARKLKVEEKH
ncbi:colipase isoform X2 [Lacerta agilis]|uniref:colipase isoform X2 n=1 Tax=Lacerta agilis TaxID=80427 RepID=UPI001419CE27|nr:colipase isoform X2 [Lacerta agilis]